MRQGDVSRLERQTDMYLSTLARFVAASGGRLRVVAEYEDADPVEIDVLGELGSEFVARSNLADVAVTSR